MANTYREWPAAVLETVLLQPLLWFASSGPLSFRFRFSNGLSPSQSQGSKWLKYRLPLDNLGIFQDMHGPAEGWGVMAAGRLTIVLTTQVMPSLVIFSKYSIAVASSPPVRILKPVYARPWVRV